MKKEERKDYHKLLIATLGISLFLLISMSSIYVYESIQPKDPNAYYGSLGNMNWLSSGYNENLKGIVNNFIITLMNYKVSNINGDIDIKIEDEFGKDHLGDFKIKHNKATGETSFSFKFIFPGGLIKDINYSIEINHDKNLSNYLDFGGQNNWTLSELLKYFLSSNKNITFTGTNSNITLSPTNDYSALNPKFNIQYVRNIPMDDNEIVVPVEDIDSNVLNDTQVYIETPVVEDRPVDNLTSPTIDLPAPKKESIIINATPKSSILTLSEGSEKLFKVYNEEYDEIKWYLDNKINDEGTSTYKLKGLTPGEYSLKVVLIKGSLSQSKSWDITIERKESPNKGSGWILLLIIFLILSIAIIIGIILIKKFSKTT